MTKFPKISIITPSYNQGHFIEETIISVIGQGYPNLEYIVMDGGSTDNTVDILKKYDDQITYWQSEKDKGQSDAINQGFRKATGDILMWLNSDDMLLPGTLYYISNKVKETGDGVYFGNCIHFRDGEELWTMGSNVTRDNRDLDLKSLDYIIQPSSWWTRKVWEDVGLLSEELHYVFDWEWFIRAQEIFKFYPIQKAISLYRFHEEHKSGTGGDKRRLEILSVLRKYSPREAILYEMLMNESDNIVISFWNRQKIQLKKFKYRIKEKPFPKELVLKLIKKKKYQDYTLDEIIKFKHY